MPTLTDFEYQWLQDEISELHSKLAASQSALAAAVERENDLYDAIATFEDEDGVESNSHEWAWRTCTEAYREMHRAKRGEQDALQRAERAEAKNAHWLKAYNALEKQYFAARDEIESYGPVLRATEATEVVSAVIGSQDESTFWKALAKQFVAVQSLRAARQDAAGEPKEKP